MSRNRKLEVGIINVTIHPHAPEKYIQLFQKAAKQVLMAKIGYNQSAIISTLGKYDPLDDDENAPIRGEIVKFNDINVEGAWFDLENKKEADESALAKISIPEHLKPNMTRFHFIFYPQKHVIFYEAYDRGERLLPTVAEKIFRNILNHHMLIDEFGVVNITHFPQEDAVDAALNTKTIRKLEFEITRPNADHFKEQEIAFLQKMNVRNVAKISEEQTAIKGQSIILDEFTKTKAQIAARNGHLKVEGKNAEGFAVSISTKEHPRIETSFYDSAKETTLSFLYKMATKIIAGL